MPNIIPNSALSALAHSLLAGPLALETLTTRARHTLGRNYPWLPALLSGVAQTFAPQTRPRHRTLINFLRHHPILQNVRALPIAQHLPAPPQMVSPFAWPVPPLPTLSELAAYFAITPTQLAWFADPNASHYHGLTQPKPSGGLRHLAAPKPCLKAIQRQLLSGILNHLSLHPAAHGFCPGRSVLSFVAPHVAQPAILRLDLADFFPSISKPRVAALFRTADYPEPVADTLAGLCCHRGTLPQGAPTSPALANAIAFKLDCRLSGLANSLHLQYTRYADDLALSGPRLPHNLADHVGAILLDEGFTPNYRKTRRMGPAQRQHLTGLTLNEKPNLPRPAYDELKAILTNCLRHGPESQNRQAHPAFAQHLQGRILHLATVNPTRAARLQKLYNQVTFP